MFRPWFGPAQILREYKREKTSGRVGTREHIQWTPGNLFEMSRRFKDFSGRMNQKLAKMTGFNVVVSQYGVRLLMFRELTFEHLRSESKTTQFFGFAVKCSAKLGHKYLDNSEQVFG